MSNTQNIGELVGQASTLFYNKKTKLLDGVFDEKQAQEIVDKIQALMTEARIDEQKHSLNKGYYNPDMEPYAEDRIAKLERQIKENK